MKDIQQVPLNTRRPQLVAINKPWTLTSNLVLPRAHLHKDQVRLQVLTVQVLVLVAEVQELLASEEKAQLMVKTLPKDIHQKVEDEDS